MLRILTLLIFLTINIFIPTKGEKYTRFTSCDCVVNQEYVNLTICNLKALSRETVIANVECFLKKDVVNATMHLSFLKMSSSGIFYPFLFDHWATVCEASKESPQITFVMKQCMRIIRKYSNGVKCHHKADLYYFRGVDIQYQFLKFFLENGRYKLKIDFYESINKTYIPLGNYTAVFDVLDKYKRKKISKKNVELLEN